MPPIIEMQILRVYSIFSARELENHQVAFHRFADQRYAYRTLLQRGLPEFSSIRVKPKDGRDCRSLGFFIVKVASIYSSWPGTPYPHK